MRIAEIFHSIQGEGLLCGTSSLFVRTSGCNLRCWYCDTPYASWFPEGDDLSVEEIMARIEQWDVTHVVLTGGEPMLHAELIPLSNRLASLGRHVTIETAGTLDLPVTCDLMSVSPKLSNSLPPRDRDARWHRRHDRTRHVPQVIERLTREYVYQIKFVIDVPNDCRDVQRYLTEFPHLDPGRILLMPQGTTCEELDRRAQWLKPYAESHGLRYGPRRQIEWFGAARGT